MSKTRCQTCGREARSNPHGTVEHESFVISFPFDVCTRCADLMLTMFSALAEELSSSTEGANVEVRYNNILDRLHQNGVDVPPMLPSPSMVVTEFLREVR